MGHGGIDLLRFTGEYFSAFRLDRGLEEISSIPRWYVFCEGPRNTASWEGILIV